MSECRPSRAAGRFSPMKNRYSYFLSLPSARLIRRARAVATLYNRTRSANVARRCEFVSVTLCGILSQRGK
jgi:hypothetical protein